MADGSAYRRWLQRVWDLLGIAEEGDAETLGKIGDLLARVISGREPLPETRGFPGAEEAHGEPEHVPLIRVACPSVPAFASRGASS